MRAAIVVAILMSTACASTPKQKEPCVPVADEYAAMLAAGRVYAACEVTEQAKPHEQQVTMPGPRQPVCYTAEFDVVVDTTGRLLVPTAKLVKTNNAGFASAALEQLKDASFTPAKKDGQRVRQLVRYPMRYEIRAFAISKVGTPGAGTKQLSPAC